MNELHTPDFTKVLRKTYAVYTFNRHKLGEELPVSVTLPNRNGGIASWYGATVMNALATQMDRPIIGVDMPGDGLSHKPRPSRRGMRFMTVPAQAAVRLRILDKMGIGQVDAMGVCMGGAIAAHMAVQGEGRVRKLLTYATPGFNDFADMDAMDRLPEDEEDYTRSAIREDGIHFGDFDHLQDDKENIVAEAVFTYMGISTCLSRLDYLRTRLHANTQWQDVVGANDDLTKWQNHVDTVEARDETLPGSSSVKVLDGVGHEFSRQRIVLTARDAELALR